MIAIICVDDNYGMMFHNRRQSRDILLCKHILDITQNNKLFMNDYTSKLFSNVENENIIVKNDFLEVASKGDYCFIEHSALFHQAKEIEKIILYRWNRNYPADEYFRFPVSNEMWQLESTSELKGNSHDIITEEVYINV